MQADLPLRLLMLIYDRGRVNRLGAAVALGVSVRTISRCTESLHAQAAPVVVRKGPGGGWNLEESYRRRLEGFGRPMAEARLAYALKRDAGRSGFETAVETPGPPGLKARAADPPGGRWPPSMLIDPTGWSGDLRHGDEAAALQQAIAESRVVTFSAEGRSWRVEPLALVWKVREFYLLGREGGGERVFPALHIGDLRVEDAKFDPSGHESSAAAWEAQLAAQGPAVRRVRVRLRIHMQAVPDLTRRHAPGRAPTIPALKEALMAPNRPGPDGWYDAAFEYDDLDYLILALWPVAGDVEVIAPPELNARLAEHIDRLKGGR
jgi:predicted DNA-binding transcriptional regulator YafY